ncbi:hypothetical protein NDU88_003545 [Pleurodeles waltl]|uniref:Uncharacterized protein n=1 Tax=Pleurodeles waltl TaxID=8319 RepID=A0AAV7RD67_PLEWA|nr:hypothetical protein NDU88_003545 [Pleurodeles waltl]
MAGQGPLRRAQVRPGVGGHGPAGKARGIVALLPGGGGPRAVQGHLRAASYASRVLRARNPRLLLASPGRRRQRRDTPGPQEAVHAVAQE